MKTIKVNASKSYDVKIGAGLLKDLGNELLSVLKKPCKIAVISVTQDMFLKTGTDKTALDAIKPITRQIEGVKAGVTLREENDGVISVSLRTDEDVDAAAICAHFGGGGHVRAAGCELKNKDIIASIPVEEKNKLKNNFPSKTLESITINNEYYGYPFSINNSYHLFYNNKFINDQDATSLEAILSKAKELKKQIYLDVANGDFISSFFLSPQACGLNSISYRYDEKGNAIYTSNWDNEEGVKISSYLSKLFNSYYLDGTISLPGGESLDTFIKEVKK